MNAYQPMQEIERKSREVKGIFCYKRRQKICPQVMLCLGIMVPWLQSLKVWSQQTKAMEAESGSLSGWSRLMSKNDYKKSPYTGYTRKHWLEITEKIIAGELPRFNAQTGMPAFAVPANDTAFERLRWKAPEEIGKRAVERMMMAVIIYIKATGNDFLPGYRGSISAPFINAIVRGTDPNDKSYWGDPLPNDQVGSVFAMAAYIDPKHWWEPLTLVQKSNLLSYLKKQVYVSTYDNNHYYFHMIPVALLEANRYEGNREHLTKMFERLMAWYRGDGWFIDGNNRTFDYYNLWGFQLFNGVLYRYDTTWRKQYGERIRSTTAAFLKMLPYLYGRDGGPIPWGRSLAYRFAGNAAIGWAVLNGNSTLPPGQARRIASGSLKYFWEHGCVGRDSLLSIGYWGANASVAEAYLYYGDPYWAAHGLAPLLIPEGDPFWTDTEQPIPADKNGGSTKVDGAQFVLRVNAIDGEARMYPVGQPLGKDRPLWQGGPKYDQHAYSSYLGFCLTGEGGEDIGAGRTGYSYDGKKWFYRERAKPVQMEKNHLVSRYTLKPLNEKDSTPDYNRDEITTHTLMGSDGEVHVFWHNSPEPLYLYLGGYGITAKDENLSENKMNGGILINAGNYYSLMKAVQATDGNFSSRLLLPRPGWGSTHLFGGNGAFPFWQSTKPVPANTAVVFFVNGTRSRKPVIGDIRVSKKGSELSIFFEGKNHLVHVPF